MRRDLAGRAVLIAAGVGTALGAGAGLANAAPLEGGLQQDQSQPTDALTGSLPQAPNLSMTDGLAQTQAAKPLDAGPVSGDQLAGLGANGLLSGLGSGGGNAEEAGSTDPSGATDQASGATDSASGATEGASGSTEDAATPSASGSGSTDPSTGSSGMQGEASPAGSSEGSSGEYTATYGAS
ncbi:MAG: hypothetical protein M3235_08190 [Actinomycetota bacterium]|nr:hypothetical protein [Actinomycetota bacterium]